MMKGNGLLPRRALILLGSSVLTLSGSGCLGILEDDEPPDPEEVLHEFFDRLDEVDLEAVSALLHPESPINLDAIDVTFYERTDILLENALPLRPELGANVSDVVQDDSDRVRVSTVFSTSPRHLELYSSTFELRRRDGSWLVYDEIRGNVEAFGADPFTKQ